MASISPVEMPLTAPKLLTQPNLTCSLNVLKVSYRPIATSSKLITFNDLVYSGVNSVV